MHDTDKIFVRTWHMSMNYYSIYDINENGYTEESFAYIKNNREENVKYYKDDIEITAEQFHAYGEELMSMDLERLYLTQDEIDFYEYLTENLFYSLE